MKYSNEEMHPLFGLSPEEAVDMLIADHKRVANLFTEFKRLIDEGEDRKKAGVVKQICQELSIHAQVEEELFYPAVREATGAEEQVDEAVVEHAGAKMLIAQLQEASPDDDLYDARVTVLGEQISHHVEEEEGSMFPRARHSGLDGKALGAKMRARKAELKIGAAESSRPSPAGNGGSGVGGGEDVTAQPSPAKKRAQSVKASPPRPKSKAR